MSPYTITVPPESAIARGAAIATGGKLFGQNTRIACNHKTFQLK
jgi:hypothetical protein